jgi:hypothetical protein
VQYHPAIAEFFEKSKKECFKYSTGKRKKVHKTIYNLNFARVGGLQSQGGKGEAGVGYREPLATLNLKSSSTPEG